MKNISKYKLKFKTTYLFYIFILINTFFKGIGLGNDSKVYLICLTIVSALLVYKILNDKYTKKEFTFIIISVILALLTFFISRKPTLALTILCLIGMKNIDIDDVFYKIYIVRFVTFFAVIILAIVGIIDNIKVEMWRNGEMDTRYSLGFGHPNTLHLSLFILITSYIYIRGNKIKIIEQIGMVILNFAIYSFSGSRTGFIITLLIVFLSLIVKIKSKILRKFIIWIPFIIYVTLIIFSFITGFLYGKVEFIDKLNVLLNGRIKYSNYYLETYGLSFFGSNIQNDHNALLDNGYVYMYIQLGIIGLIYLTYLYYLICKEIKKSNNIYRAILLICFFIYIFTESFSVNIFMNIILLFSSESIFKDKRLKEKSKQKGKIYNEESYSNNTGI